MHPRGLPKTGGSLFFVALLLFTDVMFKLYSWMPSKKMLTKQQI